MRGGRAGLVAVAILLCGAAIASAQQVAGAASTQQVAASAQEVVAEIRVHGNYTTPEAAVLKIAGLAVGQTIDQAGLDAIKARLEKSGRFDAVDIRKRLRSLEATDQVAIIIIVQEVPASPSAGMMPGPLRKLGDKVMLLPTLNWVDGYGLTYGARVSFVRVLGKKGMISIPLTWGATREAAIELDKTIDKGVVSRLRGGAALISRRNPGFDVRDSRKTLWAEASTASWNAISLGVRGSWSEITFGGARDHLSTVGAGITLDTRETPSFPRDAAFVSAWWTRLAPQSAQAVNRLRVDAQFYFGLVGSTVLSARVVTSQVDGRLPSYEKPLLGGGENLRGFAAGSFVGDNLTAGSIELRIPNGSVMRVGQNAFTVFADAGKVYDFGTKLDAAKLRSSVGVGWYLKLPILQLNVDVAHGLGRTSGIRVHVSAALKL